MINDKFYKGFLGNSSIAALSQLNKIQEQMNKRATLVGLSGIQNIINSRINIPQPKHYNSISELALGSMARYNYIDKIAKSYQSPLMSSSSIQSLINYQESLNKKYKPIDRLISTSNFIERYNLLQKTVVPSYLKVLTGLAPIIERQSNLQKQVNKFLTLSTDNFFQEIIAKNDSDSLKTAEDNLSELIEIANEIKDNQILTFNQVTKLNTLLSKPGTTNFIYFIIQILLAVILFALSANINQNESDATENNIEIDDNAKVEFSKTLNLLCLEERIVERDVNLRLKPNTKSPIIDVLSKDKVILVQQFNHKWIYVIYQDDEYLMRSGWVYKKYTRKVK